MLAIGRGLMSQPEFLAIDEPSFGLAPNLRSDVFRTIGQIKGRDISIILVEQSVTEVADLADRVYLLEDGRIAFEGTKEQVHNNPHVRKAFLGK